MPSNSPETTTSIPADFDAYWDAVDADLAAVPAAPELDPLPLRSSDNYTCYTVKLTSVGPYRLFGYFSVPTGNGPFPALLETTGYGSVNHVPGYNDRLRYVVLTIMHRGQRLADQPFAATYPGLLTRHVDNPALYIYRNILADCLRAAEFLASRAEVDRSRIAISGDDLAVITAARRPVFKAAQIGGSLLYRLDEARRRTDAYPTEEVNDYLRAHPERAEAVANTLSYFCARAHAPKVTATTQLSVGDAGGIGGPEWLAPLAGALGGPVEQFTQSHSGQADHEALDAWLAGQLGTQPMVKFRAELD